MLGSALLLVELVALFFGVSFGIELLQRRIGPERVKAWMGGRPVVAGLLADEASRLEEIAAVGRAQVAAQAEGLWSQITNRGADLGRVVDLHVESALEELERALRGSLAHLGEAEQAAVRQLVLKTAKRNAHFHLKDLRQLART